MKSYDGLAELHRQSPRLEDPARSAFKEQKHREYMVSKAFDRTYMWTWVFTGEAKYTFLRMDRVEKVRAIRAAVRLMASVKNVDGVYLWLPGPHSTVP